MYIEYSGLDSEEKYLERCWQTWCKGKYFTPGMFKHMKHLWQTGQINIYVDLEMEGLKMESQQAFHWKSVGHHRRQVIEELGPYTERTAKEKLKDWCIDSLARLFIKIRWAKQLYMDLEFYMYINDNEGGD